MSRTANRITTRLALVLAGAGLAVTGMVLLLRAAWIAMALPLGAMWASAVLGGALLFVGALFVLLATMKSHKPEHSDADLIVLVTTAFLQGLTAGRSSRHR